MTKTQHTTAPAEQWTDEERAAMKERSREVKAGSRRMTRAEKEAQDAAAVVEKIAEMQEADRVLAERIHEIVRTAAPELAPKLWYGMPAYARDGKIVCFFQSAQKFNARYATLGFNDTARLDEDTMWPTAFALTRLTPTAEQHIATLITKAAN
ncbi:DUF1801 domain-containing protein [Streptomyces sp. NPDC000983]|uniref:iron chaperone n=1 Tax=Streptomyces sp. NPDC000983 TaxID=3154373 RepID=UPI00331C8EF8